MEILGIIFIIVSIICILGIFIGLFYTRESKKWVTLKEISLFVKLYPILITIAFICVIFGLIFLYWR